MVSTIIVIYFRRSFMMEKRYFDKDNRFIIEGYNKKKPFSSFLPGIAGDNGIPMWVFYVNRGQAISSFGTRDKNGAIMEFFPANRAYQNVNYTGFRTFIKIYEGMAINYYEPFSSFDSNKSDGSRMIIGGNECELQEVNRDGSLKTSVLYFTLPGENIAALVRKTTITNLSGRNLKMEVLDGAPAILPYGLDNGSLKEMGNLMKAWMSVDNLEENVPFYKLRASTEDSAEVRNIEKGNFSLGFIKNVDKDEVLRPIVDAEVIFGNNTSFSFPDNFINMPLEELYEKKQATSNKVPSSFYGISRELKPEESIELYSMVGYADSIEILLPHKSKLISSGFLMNKYYEARKLVRDLTDDVYTSTSSKVFDEYCRLTYLDNILRGGYPLVMGDKEKPSVYHVYSRKHGDLERDYNFFTLEPEYYSSGNGSYRDVNQNRRSDVLFKPEIGDFNIKTFMNLIQVDGYNPLAVNGYKFIVKRERVNFFEEKVEKLLTVPFSLGRLYRIAAEGGTIDDRVQEKVELVLRECEQVIEAVHGEGYWSDHFTYNLDLIENYLAVFPDKKLEVLLKNKEYTYYDNYVFVKRRDEKYVLTAKGVRQYEAVIHDKDKGAFIDSRASNNNIMRSNKGCGEIYKCSLFSKLITLMVNKFSILDPFGMGVEMEAGKPGWDDALNGLPGIFGSSMAESYELSRIISFILEFIHENMQEEVELPIEVMKLIKDIINCIEEYNSSTNVDKQHTYWDETSKLREAFREEIKYGLDGSIVIIKLEALEAYIEGFKNKLNEGIGQAFEENSQVYPTFFYYEALDYELILDENMEKRFNKNGLSLVRVSKFKQNKMPLFLEGVVRALKMQHTDAALVYEKVKESPLFDNKLKMYKLNAPLTEMPIEIGRLKAFTPGWLENETIWLHMEYKYMLEILKCGLYDKFFEDFKNVMIPFLDPEVYGRSTLENSSFIASSANPDEATHGTGYFARLSGATAEFLSIWSIMLAGENPFFMKNKELCLELKPTLPDWLFNEENKVSFKFLGRTMVTYNNSKRISTYENGLVKNTIITYRDGRKIEIKDSRINQPYSIDVREGKIEHIMMEF
jgi:hypothetical protein